jgi:hypothetical protein
MYTYVYLHIHTYVYLYVCIYLGSGPHDVEAMIEACASSRIPYLIILHHTGYDNTKGYPLDTTQGPLGNTIRDEEISACIIVIRDIYDSADNNAHSGGRSPVGVGVAGGGVGTVPKNLGTSPPVGAVICPVGDLMHHITHLDLKAQVTSNETRL